MTTATERVHAFSMQGSAVTMWRDKGPEVLLSGPAGTGKSRVCLEKMHALMLKYPRSRGLICARRGSRSRPPGW